MLKSRPIGVCAAGLVRPSGDVTDSETRFAIASDAGVFDYIATAPEPGMIDQDAPLAERCAMPIRGGLFCYELGARYSILDHNGACARWIRSGWQALQGNQAAELAHG